MVLCVRDSKGPLRIRPFLRTMEYPLEITGAFRSSDEQLNRIWKACARTQQVCSIDAYVDTPWREQAQWWGDARVQAWNTFHLAGDSRLFRRGIRQIAGQVVPNGLTYGHAPTIAHSCILPDFSLTWILTLWDYYWQTGSVEPLLVHENVAWGILDYFQGMIDPKSGLATYDKRYWLFLDWAELSKEGTPTILNLWLLIALQKLAELYEIAGAKEKQRILLRRVRDLSRALGALVNPHGLILDGLDKKGRKIAKTSVHSQTLALTANLPCISTRATLEQVILPYIRGRRFSRPSPRLIGSLTFSPFCRGTAIIAKSSILLPSTGRRWLITERLGKTTNRCREIPASHTRGRRIRFIIWRKLWAASLKRHRLGARSILSRNSTPTPARSRFRRRWGSSRRPGKKPTPALRVSSSFRKA